MEFARFQQVIETIYSSQALLEAYRRNFHESSAHMFYREFIDSKCDLQYLIERLGKQKKLPTIDDFRLICRKSNNATASEAEMLVDQHILAWMYVLGRDGVGSKEPFSKHRKLDFYIRTIGGWGHLARCLDDSYERMDLMKRVIKVLRGELDEHLVAEKSRIEADRARIVHLIEEPRKSVTPTNEKGPLENRWEQFKKDLRKQKD